MDTTIAFDATWADTFKRRWAELAGADGLLGEDTFGGEDPQIASQITRIKALPKQPDFIVLCSFPPGGVSAMRQLRAAEREPAAAGLGILGRRLSGSKACRT